MLDIVQIPITETMIKHSDILENEYALYVAGTPYGDGDHCIYAHKIYESLQAANTGNTPSSSPAWWEDLGYDNRWQVFDLSVQSQSDQATSMTWVLRPGSTVDSAAILNMDADSVRIKVADAATPLVNETAWTGASGGTPPTGWSIGYQTPASYAIDAGWLKIVGSTTQQHSGCYKSLGATAGWVYQFTCKYKTLNTSHKAEFWVYDSSNSADIVAKTALASVAEATFEATFTIPAGCTAFKVYIMAEDVNDEVWFDDAFLARVYYDSGVVSMTSATDYVTTALTSYANPQITIIVAKSTTAYCGGIILGVAFSLGKTLGDPAPEVGIDDFSIVEADEYGNYTITERKYNKKMSITTRITSANYDSIYNHMAANRATPVVYIGNSTLTSFSCMIVYGFPKTWNMKKIEPYGYLTAEFWGLT